TVTQGVYVSGVLKGSAAADSGILPGDVIVAIDNHIVNSVSELQEWVARNRPGNEILVTYLRKGNKADVRARLKNSEGKESFQKKEIKDFIEGAKFEDVPYRELAKLLLDGGVKVVNVSPGKWKKAGIKKDFIIAFIDKVPVDNVEDLNRILEYKKGGVLVEGFYTDGEKGTYGMEW
ncbi:MAG TPA: PDZ domain-containing protein, partial [Chryseosolibacter sp.]